MKGGYRLPVEGRRPAHINNPQKGLERRSGLESIPADRSPLMDEGSSLHSEQSASSSCFINRLCGARARGARAEPAWQEARRASGSSLLEGTNDQVRHRAQPGHSSVTRVYTNVCSQPGHSSITRVYTNVQPARAQQYYTGIH
ncbi:hypothetical protein NDU88_005308 [Pleurodeles waltl]|uniref:Uncharacterized protein n=1 Tax=Pleurodeles waltl TaxID=8319 RepID=A0AAV7LC44_PLEWA|nr:hypothetical protein NDU88_005308 [Pleurodeles waltl]